MSDPSGLGNIVIAIYLCDIHSKNIDGSFFDLIIAIAIIGIIAIFYYKQRKLAKKALLLIEDRKNACKNEEEYNLIKEEKFQIVLLKYGYPGSTLSFFTNDYLEVKKRFKNYGYISLVGFLAFWPLAVISSLINITESLKGFIGNLVVMGGLVAFISVPFLILWLANYYRLYNLKKIAMEAEIDIQEIEEKAKRPEMHKRKNL